MNTMNGQKNVFERARQTLELIQDHFRHTPPKIKDDEQLELDVIFGNYELIAAERAAITHVLGYAFETARIARTRVGKGPYDHKILVRPENFPGLIDVRTNLDAHIDEFSAMLRSGWRASASGGKPVHVKEFPGGREQWACPRVKLMIDVLGSAWGKVNHRHSVRADAVPSFLKITGPLEGQVEVLQQFGVDV